MGYLGLSLSLSLTLPCFLYTCGLKATNDVIMIYHVPEQVSLFLLQKNERNQYWGAALPSGAAVPPLDWPGKG